MITLSKKHYHASYLTLVERGQTEYAILMDPDAPETVRFAGDLSIGRIN